jgi:FKBP-type peptidyl-prolyl cis-trans isomerase
LPDASLRFQITLLEVLHGIDYQVTQPGEGPIARPGDMVEMHYVAYIVGRHEAYDSSYTHRKPLSFRIGDGQVIVGWELGVSGMARGEKRTLTIPPYLAYGSRGAGKLIPPNAALQYEIELLRILPDGSDDSSFTRRTLPGSGW